MKSATDIKLTWMFLLKTIMSMVTKYVVTNLF